MSETSSDANPFKGNSSKNKTKPIQAEVKLNPDEDYYDMSGERLMVIFNHRTFQATRYFNNRAPTSRTGTDHDVAALKSLFGEKLGFKVQVFHNKEYSDLWTTLIHVRGIDFTDTSCVCVVILTHGSSKDELYAADRSYELGAVLKLFEDIPTLINKPKLFFVQACRGSEVDPGFVCKDGDMGNCTYIVPSHADFLLIRSTIENYRSYRDYRGSWMIQELCNVFQEDYKNQDIHSMITKMNRRVAYNYVTYTPSNESTNKMKQIPETTHTLTKLLKF